MTLDKVERDLLNFHMAFDHNIGGPPAVPDDATVVLRERLIREEYGELMHAMAEGDLVEILDGACDLVYVVVGTCVSYGLPFSEGWDEVQRANMAKLVDGKHERDAGGKTVKPPGWQPPDLARIIEEHREAVLGVERAAEGPL